MMKYFSVLTALGEQKLAKAAAEGTAIQLIQMAVGDGGGTLPVPDVNQTQLVHENYRANINTLKLDSTKLNRVIAELVVPSSVGGWWTREIGLFDSEGGLFAVGNCPETYKPSRTEGASGDQILRMVLKVSHTDRITITYDPFVAAATVGALNEAVASLNTTLNTTLNQAIEVHEKSRNHPDATLTAKGFTQLSSSVTSLDETMAATPKAIKIAMDNALTRLAKDRNGADIPNVALFRQNIELGNSATLNVGTTLNTVAAGNDSRIVNAVPNTRMINGLTLHTNIQLAPRDIGAYDKAQIDQRFAGYVPNTRTINTLPLTSNLTLTPDIIGVPKNTALTAVNGWWKCGDTGLIIQWGKTPSRPNGTANYPLPIPFPNQGMWAFGYVSAAMPYDNDNISGSAGLLGSAPNTTIRVTIDNGVPTAWMAIGY